jgi:hypothetical protein
MFCNQTLNVITVMAPKASQEQFSVWTRAVYMAYYISKSLDWSRQPLDRNKEATGKGKGVPAL